MKTLVIGTVSMLLFAINSVSLAQQNDCGDAREAVEKIKAAVEKEDVQQIVALIGEGLWVTDTPYKRDKVLALLKNKKSWLYQGLFGKRDSMKKHLSSGNVEIRIQKEGEANLIDMIAKDSKALPPSFNLMCIGGRWQLTDIYSF